MREVKRVQVGERFFIIQQFGAQKALKLMHKLAKVLGKPLALLLKDGTSISMDGIGEAIQSFAASMDSDQFVELVSQLLEETSLHDTVQEAKVKINIEQHFSGDEMSDLFLLLKEVIVFNGGFFSKLLSSLSAKA